MSLGGAVRLRGENWNGFGAGAAPGRDFFALSRVLLKSEFRYRGWGSVVAEVKSSLAASRSLAGEERPIDEDVLDVQQLYAEFRPPSVRLRGSVRAGRFDLALGRERLVSPLDWVNARRTFQGAAAAITLRDIELRAFWVEPVAVRRRKPNTVDSTRQLSASTSRRDRSRRTGCGMSCAPTPSSTPAPAPSAATRWVPASWPVRVRAGWTTTPKWPGRLAGSA